MRIWGPAVVFFKLKSLFTPGKLTIGRRSRIEWGARILFHRGRISLGEEVRIHPGVVIDAQKGEIRVGSNVSFNSYVVILGAGGVSIGHHVRIAAHAVIVSFDHNFSDPNLPITQQGITKKPVSIGDDVWLGAGAKVLGGANVANGCVVAAGAVVKGNTEPYGIYAGVPARKVGSRLVEPVKN